MNKNKTVTIEVNGLALILIFLKLVGVINWSWWWVLCPLWIGFALFLVFWFFAFMGTIIYYWFFK